MAFDLPSLDDFKQHGRFHRLKIPTNVKDPLPIELFNFCFKDFKDIMFKTKPPPSKKSIDMVRRYCLSMQKQAKKEERNFKLKSIKEAETRELEANMKSYFKEYYEKFYKDMYKNCRCNNVQ
jgi:hypothetical protein